MFERLWLTIESIGSKEERQVERAASLPMVPNHAEIARRATTGSWRGPKDREQTNRARDQSLLHPGLGEDRFGQLRVKAAFGPGFTGAARP